MVKKIIKKIIKYMGLIILFSVNFILIGNIPNIIEKSHVLDVPAYLQEGHPIDEVALLAPAIVYPIVAILNLIV